MTSNEKIAARLDELADLLEAQDVEYKPRAYRTAADNVRSTPDSVSDLVANGLDAVREIEGVGEAIGEKIVEYVETGAIEELNTQRESLPVEMEAVTRVEGVGPKTAGKLYEALGIQTLDDLEDAAEAGDIQEVSGFGAKTEQNILGNIEFARHAGQRSLLGNARAVGEEVTGYLANHAGVEAVKLAGSLRRWRPTIGDVDVLVATEEPISVTETVTEWDEVTSVIESGSTKTSLRVSDMQVDIRFVDPAEFGAALVYFTGSRDHNIALRNRAIDSNQKVNEYGVFEVTDAERADPDTRAGTRIAGKTESSVYEALDLPWIPPELRENRGEIPAAAAGDLPDLVTEADLQGDLHTHTNWSDGDFSIEEMVEGAVEYGHEYLVISDHAEGPGVFGDSGLSEDDIHEQIEAVQEVAADTTITVLTGIEANISPDGTVGETDPNVLADLDVVIASPHADIGDGEDRTERLVTAIEHPEVDILGHPSGRLLNQRPAMEFDPSKIGQAAAENGVALEINANPNRLDLWGSALAAAIEEEATIAINTDAHDPREFAYQRFGVHTARRGWATAADILNTRTLNGLRQFLE
ncbi:DNA polymerase/3'-5' exonuclease PolX [Halodesulfurarchaeum sp.]|uniref:DNA polymerase/3'-5' exonuclease PolX n=1 Tax=Halodesulfurarchaeum sp. TaxID=1980530 RepID=UPI001BB8ACA6|nr:DNA polymerase/3'-5' exonuclease PolX [Halodesulfurarchaeum sp.]